MLIHDRIEHLITSLEQAPVEKLIICIEWCQAVAALIAFIFVWVILDTLPSFRPLTEHGSNLHVAVHNSERVVTFSEKLVIFKPAEYTIKRTVHYTGGYVEFPDTQSILTQVSTSTFPAVIPVGGPVCVERTIFWTPGLSIRQHSLQLEPICVR